MCLQWSQRTSRSGRPPAIAAAMVGEAWSNSPMKGAVFRRAIQGVSLGACGVGGRASGDRLLNQV